MSMIKQNNSNSNNNSNNSNGNNISYIEKMIYEDTDNKIKYSNSNNNTPTSVCVSSSINSSSPVSLNSAQHQVINKSSGSLPPVIKRSPSNSNKNHGGSSSNANNGNGKSNPTGFLFGTKPRENSQNKIDDNKGVNLAVSTSNSNNHFHKSHSESNIIGNIMVDQPLENSNMEEILNNIPSSISMENFRENENNNNNNTTTTTTTTTNTLGGGNGNSNKISLASSTSSISSLSSISTSNSIPTTTITLTNTSGNSNNRSPSPTQFRNNNSNNNNNDDFNPTGVFLSRQRCKSISNPSDVGSSPPTTVPFTSLSNSSSVNNVNSLLGVASSFTQAGLPISPNGGGSQVDTLQMSTESITIQHSPLDSSSESVSDGLQTVSGSPVTASPSPTLSTSSGNNNGNGNNLTPKSQQQQNPYSHIKRASDGGAGYPTSPTSPTLLPSETHDFSAEYASNPGGKCGICRKPLWSFPISDKSRRCKECCLVVHRACVPLAPECSVSKKRSSLTVPLSSLTPGGAANGFAIGNGNGNGNNNNGNGNGKGHSRTPSSPSINTIIGFQITSNAAQNLHVNSTTISLLINGATIDSNQYKRNKKSLEASARDFHFIFRGCGIPLDEFPLDSYVCGLFSYFAHGRLYLTESYVCFYDGFVFDRTKERTKVIKISSICSIEKKSSGLNPSAIKIKTFDDQVFILTHFMHREVAFDDLEGLLIHQESCHFAHSIITNNLSGMNEAIRGQQKRLLSRARFDGHYPIHSKVRCPMPSKEVLLMSAIKNNNLDMVVTLLSYYCQINSDEINSVDSKGYTPLHNAVFSECSDSIFMHLLNQKEVRVRERNIDGNTPLHYFCQKFKSPECQKIVQAMIEKGANINEQNYNGETPLHKAIFNHSVRLLMVFILLKNNANVNIVNNAGESPLHYAVRLGRLDVAKMLLAAGADPTIISLRDRKTALALAIDYDVCPGILDLLRRLDTINTSLEMYELEKYQQSLIFQELQKENVIARIDVKLLDQIGCTDPEDRRKFLSLKNNRLLIHHPATTPGAKIILKEMEAMDIKNGRLIISQSELEYTERIGSGVSGKVYKGIYRGRVVAIKELKSADDEQHREEFLKEFGVLASLESPFIVGLYGVVLEPRICLVMEYCSNGSIFHSIRKHPPSWERFFSFVNQMLVGIKALHESTPQVLHRDIKTLNFLVNHHNKVKVADFGLSRFNTESNQETLNKTRGTSVYCAPEVFEGKEYNERSDMYSMGIVCWEMVYSVIYQRYQIPYDEYQNMFNSFQIVLLVNSTRRMLRPTIPIGTPQCLKDLINSLWEHEWSMRPIATEALVALSLCEKEYKQNQAQWEQIILKKEPTPTPIIPPLPTFPNYRKFYENHTELSPYPDEEQSYREALEKQKRNQEISANRNLKNRELLNQQNQRQQQQQQLQQ